MSGGSYQYAYGRVEDMARSLQGRHESPLRRAFARHLELVAKAMHDAEWVDSSDYGPGDDDAAIRLVLSPGAELEAAISMAEDARAALEDALARAKAQAAP